MSADSRQADFCAYLSAILFVGLLLNASLGWRWADPVAALVMVPIIPLLPGSPVFGSHLDRARHQPAGSEDRQVDRDTNNGNWSEPSARTASPVFGPNKFSARV